VWQSSYTRQIFTTPPARRPNVELCQSCYDKLLDEESQTYYYVNTMTGESSWSKPQLLGTNADIDTLEVKAKKEDRKQAQKDRNTLVKKKRKARKLEADEEKRLELQEIQDEIDRIWMPHLRQAARTNELNANCMKIERVVPPVFEMKKLVTLRLVGNNLTFIPVPLMEMTQLRIISLSNNKVAVLPERFCALTKLVELNLSNNQLRALPTTFGNLRNLEKFEIARNYLEELPESFGNLEKISQLYLEHNHLRSLPESLQDLKCHYLNLNVNKLTYLPECLNRMQNLQSLIINTNPLENLPENIADMKQLTFLSCCNTKLNTLPER
jgi:Leucine-rich repeat (LRR) protein